MAHHEFMAITFGIVMSVLYIASCVLSVVFLLKYRENRWRWLPCISLIALALIEVVPESGWSDVRSQWQLSALLVGWSVWALCLVFIILKAAKGRVPIALGSLLAIIGAFDLTGGVVSLVESWRFLHSL